MGPLTRSRKMALMQQTHSVAGERRKLAVTARSSRRNSAVKRAANVGSHGGDDHDQFVSKTKINGCSSRSCVVERIGRLRSAPDLEVAGVLTAVSFSVGTRSGSRRAREASMSTKNQPDFPTKSTPPASKLPVGSPEVATPKASEIDAFFAAAEKREQERFARKYNFDIVKDEPAEGGRYEWERLK